jgi:hypothetical protein
MASLRNPQLEMAGPEARFDDPPADARRPRVIPERYSVREK